MFISVNPVYLYATSNQYSFFMKPNDIRDYIAKGRLESAVRETVVLASDTELENLAIGISNGFRKYKKDNIAGILDSNEDSKRYNVLTQQLLNLLNEYELYQIKGVKHTVEKLTQELQVPAPIPETSETITELAEISKEMQHVELAETKDEVKPGVLQRVQRFIEKAREPDSAYNKAIKTVTNGYSILQDLAADCSRCIAVPRRGRRMICLFPWIDTPIHSGLEVPVERRHANATRYSSSVGDFTYPVFCIPRNNFPAEQTVHPAAPTGMVGIAQTDG